jgi:hypothetical protein
LSHELKIQGFIDLNGKLFIFNFSAKIYAELRISKHFQIDTECIRIEPLFIMLNKRLTLNTQKPGNEIKDIARRTKGSKGIDFLQEDNTHYKCCTAHKYQPNTSCYCHSPTQPQLELELDLIMGRKPPNHPTPPGTLKALSDNLGSWMTTSKKWDLIEMEDDLIKQNGR